VARAGETRLITTDDREIRVQRYRVRAVDGPDAGREAQSDALEFTIGTAEGNHLVLTDGTVSRHHCVITAGARGFRLADLGSRNGTRVGGCRVEAAYLEPGASFQVGGTTLRFDSLDAVGHHALSAAESYGRLLGASPAMRYVFEILPRIAASDSTVLVEGETGTGKGLIAEAIHAGGPRARGPFVVLDCGAIPANLVESELFGHQKGAFTGAHTARAGAFEAARGGTIFLDEIGELPLEMQPKLLRALEDRVVKPIGSHEPVKLDVRVVAATNRDLRREVNRGTFRSDLYYRLNIVRLTVPPLRERREDIPLLARSFWAHFSGRPDATPPAHVVSALARQDWPGNVRELRAAIERAVLGVPDAPTPAPAAAPSATPTEGAPLFDPAVSYQDAKDRAVSDWERRYVKELVEKFEGNLSRASREARMDRSHLRKLLKKYGLAGDES
jgi:DNA-binding NtrC family response regulator